MSLTHGFNCSFGPIWPGNMGYECYGFSQVILNYSPSQKYSNLQLSNKLYFNDWMHWPLNNRRLDSTGPLTCKFFFPINRYCSTTNAEPQIWKEPQIWRDQVYRRPNINYTWIFRQRDGSPNSCDVQGLTIYINSLLCI